jgi:hypothetical protein
MGPFSNKPVYDPVPPYDLEDIEGTAEATQNGGPSQPSQNLDDVPPSPPEHIVTTEPSHHRHGKLTERECCHFALFFFATAIFGLLMMTLIIAKYASHRSCKKDD